jgi:hypothetical protein
LPARKNSVVFLFPINAFNATTRERAIFRLVLRSPVIREVALGERRRLSSVLGIVETKPIQRFKREEYKQWLLPENS